jgi:hypothetical protein
MSACRRPLAAIVSLLLVAAAATQSRPASREAQVLALLRQATARSGHGRSLWELRPVPVFETGRPTRTEPRMAGMCGNSISAVVDKAVAHDLARKLFAVFDLKPAEHAALARAGVTANLDLLDEGHGIGLKIDGTTSNTVAGTPALGVGAEPPETSLSESEAKALADQGLRVLRVPAAELIVMHHDLVAVFVPLMARIVDLLNGATGGEDVDVGPLLAGWEQRWPMVRGRDYVLPGTVRFVEPTSILEVKAPTTLVLRFHRAGLTLPEVRTPRTGSGGPAWRTAPVASTSVGQVSMLSLPIGFGAPFLEGLDVRLEQRRAGREPVVVTAGGPTLFLPAALDVRLPFEITVRFAPGTYQMFEHISVLVAR